jgi:hypothetical protein
MTYGRMTLARWMAERERADEERYRRDVELSDRRDGERAEQARRRDEADAQALEEARDYEFNRYERERQAAERDRAAAELVARVEVQQ